MGLIQLEDSLPLCLGECGTPTLSRRPDTKRSSSRLGSKILLRSDEMSGIRGGGSSAALAVEDQQTNGHGSGRRKKGSSIFGSASEGEEAHSSLNGKRGSQIKSRNGSVIMEESQSNFPASPEPQPNSSTDSPGSSDRRKGSWIKRIGSSVSSSPPSSPSSSSSSSSGPRNFHSYPTSPLSTPRTSPVRRRAISVDISGKTAPAPSTSNISNSNTSHSSSNSFLASRFDLRGFSKRSRGRSSVSLQTQSAAATTLQPLPLEPQPAEDAKEINDIIEFFSKARNERSARTPKDLANTFAEALEFPMKQQCLSRLIELSKKDSNKHMLGKSLELFIELLSEEDKGLQSSMLQLVRNLVTLDVLKNRFRLVNGFPLLINLLRSNDDNLLKLAVACAGFLLSNNQSNADCFVEGGGVEVVVSLLKSPAEIVQLLAAGVTWVLASHESKHQEAVVNAGGHVLLLDVLSSATNIDLQWQAAGAIRNLAYKNEVVQKALFQLGAVQILLNLLNTTTNEKVVGHLAAALLALGESLDVQEFMRESGGFSAIFGVIDNIAYSSAIRELGLAILRALVLGNKTSQTWAVTKTKALDLAFQLLKDSQEGIRLAACQLFEALIQGNLETAEMLTKREVFRLLLRLLPSESAKMAGAILHCLGIFCEEFRPNLEELQSSDNLATVLKGLFGSPEIQENTAQLLGRLALFDTRFAEALGNGSCVSTMLDCLQSSDLGVVESTVKTLCILFENEAVVKKNVQAANKNKGKSIHRLASFMVYDKEVELQINSCKILRSLSIDESIRANIVASGGVLVLINCLSSPSPTLVLESLQAIEMIVAKPPKLQNLWREQGVFPKMLPLLSSQNFDLVAASLSTTTALCHGNSKSQEAIRNAGLFSPILKCVGHPDSRLNIGALQLIRLLAQERSTKIRSAIMKTPGALDALILNIREGFPCSEQVRQETLTTLAVLCTTLKLQNALREVQDGLATIAAFCTNIENGRDPTLISAALSVVVALCRKNPANREAFKQLHLAEALKALQESEESLLRRLGSAQDVIKALGQ